MAHLDYSIKTPQALTSTEIHSILMAWDVDSWRNLSVSEFTEAFAHSEFHLLKRSDDELRCVARINFDFKICIGNNTYLIPEFVGFAALKKGEGFGTKLLNAILENVTSRNIELIGFCEMPLRNFYEKFPINIFLGQAKHIKEKVDEVILESTDDDILDLNLFPETSLLMQSLNERNTALIV